MQLTLCVQIELQRYCQYSSVSKYCPAYTPQIKNLPTLTFLGSLSALENGKNRNMCDIKPKHGKTVGMDPEKKSSHGAPIADISRFSTVVLECDPSSYCYSSCQEGTLGLKAQ